MYDRTNIHTIQHLFSQAGVNPKRSMGQNFLISPEVVEAMIGSLNPRHRCVTELGAGLGAVTQSLLSAGYSVKAIEKDDVLASLLPGCTDVTHRKNLTVTHADMRYTDWTWQEPYQIVGNIPYNLSGLVIRKITSLIPVPTRAILTVQKEVGVRMMADAPDMNLMSLSVRLWGNAAKLLNIPPSCFWPQPHVTSQLMLLIPSVDAPLPDQDRERKQILSLAQTLFQTKRKQIAGALRKTLFIPEKNVSKILASCSISRNVRPQELTLNQWIQLAQVLEHSR